jgi:hypothetical protein
MGEPDIERLKNIIHSVEEISVQINKMKNPTPADAVEEELKYGQYSMESDVFRGVEEIYKFLKENGGEKVPLFDRFVGDMAQLGIYHSIKDVIPDEYILFLKYMLRSVD